MIPDEENLELTTSSPEMGCENPEADAPSEECADAPAEECNSETEVCLEWEPRMRQYSRDVMITQCDPDNIPSQCRIPADVTPCPECYILRDPRNLQDMWLITSKQYAKFVKP